MKKLSEMTLEELWHLFPISLVSHREEWKEYYKEMEEHLKNILSDYKYNIYHIGSTAIKGIWAKNIVDILIETDEDLGEIAKRLSENNFIIMSETKDRISLNYGYTEKGFAEKVYHIHLRHTGDCDEIYFRDYLNNNPQVAKEYEKLKLDLWKKYEFDRDAYTEAKGEFIKKYTEIGKIYRRNNNGF